MARIADKERAQKLRVRGRSIRDIAKIVTASKSSVSYWCRNIVLSEKQLKALMDKSAHFGRANCIRLGEEKRKKRIQTIKKQKGLGAKTTKKLSMRELYILGLGLYWGEGYKTSNDEFGFTNSDPHMISIYLQWLSKCLGVKLKDLILRVSINNVHAYREKEVIDYWRKITNISKSQFTKTSFLTSKSNKIYENHKDHHGTLRIKVRRGMKLKYKTLGAIEKITTEI